MATYPEIQLCRLRDIGWSAWNPIGLETVKGAWRDSQVADEYDAYLLHIVSLLRRRASESECVQYLEKIEADHMGMGVRNDARHRAAQTVRAIAQYLASLPHRPAQRP